MGMVRVVTIWYTHATKLWQWMYNMILYYTCVSAKSHLVVKNAPLLWHRMADLFLAAKTVQLLFNMLVLGFSLNCVIWNIIWERFFCAFLILKENYFMFVRNSNVNGRSFWKILKWLYNMDLNFFIKYFLIIPNL